MSVVPYVNTSPGVLTFNALQVMLLFNNNKTEKANPMPYSKFANISEGQEGLVKIPSQTGMLIIYVPATIVAFMFQCVLPSLASVSYQSTIAGWMVLAHFLKRDAEVLFLHRYSGEIDKTASIAIGISYALNSLMICLVSNPLVSDPSLTLGTGLFAVGLLGNFYHHYLLALLRAEGGSKPGGGTKEYRAPRGGFFEYVAAPHYFFELIGWAGIAVASQQITSYLVFLGMASYLFARSENQNEWNKKKFDEKDWPASRKNLIPFVF